MSNYKKYLEIVKYGYNESGFLPNNDTLIKAIDEIKKGTKITSDMFKNLVLKFTNNKKPSQEQIKHVQKKLEEKNFEMIPGIDPGSMSTLGY